MPSLYAKCTVSRMLLLIMVLEGTAFLSSSCAFWGLEPASQVHELVAANGALHAGEAATPSVLSVSAAIPSVPRSVWVQRQTALLAAAGTSQVVARVGQNFPLMLLGGTAWKDGRLWYHVQWTTPKNVHIGWVLAASVTFTAPGDVPGEASLDVLSPALAAYLARLGDNVGVVVYDRTAQRYYSYNRGRPFIAGSSMKVPILLTFLDMTERQGRVPNDDEMNWLTTMIENSDNDSASALYYGEIGGAEGVARYLQRIGINSLRPDPTSWGYSLITPQAMVNLLTLLYAGEILTAQDRNLVLYLMEHVEPDQRVGVGDRAPVRSTVALKDGWVLGPDNLWAVNSSGIVMLKQKTYIITVYSQEQPDLNAGQAIARLVCGTVASLLT